MRPSATHCTTQDFYADEACSIASRTSTFPARNPFRKLFQITAVEEDVCALVPDKDEHKFHRPRADGFPARLTLRLSIRGNGFHLPGIEITPDESVSFARLMSAELHPRDARAIKAAAFFSGNQSSKIRPQTMLNMKLTAPKMTA